MLLCTSGLTYRPIDFCVRSEEMALASLARDLYGEGRRAGLVGRIETQRCESVLWVWRGP